MEQGHRSPNPFLLQRRSRDMHMVALDWNPAWETGIRKIDEQHRALFGQVEMLMNAIHTEEASSRLPDLMAFLVQYVELHFQNEEAEMKASGYPELTSHRAIHDNLRADVAELMLRFQKDPTVITDAVLDFLTKWLIEHINGDDRRMALYLIHWASERSQPQE
jgi:hemerythrin